MTDKGKQERVKRKKKEMDEVVSAKQHPKNEYWSTVEVIDISIGSKIENFRES